MRSPATAVEVKPDQAGLRIAALPNVRRAAPRDDVEGSARGAHQHVVLAVAVQSPAAATRLACAKRVVALMPLVVTWPRRRRVDRVVRSAPRGRCTSPLPSPVTSPRRGDQVHRSPVTRCGHRGTEAGLSARRQHHEAPVARASARGRGRRTGQVRRLREGDRGLPGPAGSRRRGACGAGVGVVEGVGVGVGVGVGLGVGVVDPSGPRSGSAGRPPGPRGSSRRGSDPDTPSARRRGAR